jgi:cytochrome c-type biogenesis protein CcmH/NrfG
MPALDLPGRARLPLATTSIVVLATAAALLAPSPVPAETREAREQARLCERLDEQEGVDACRSALALGLDPERRGPVREILARHLVDLESWSELADHYREDVRLAPEDARGWARLGSTLLFALNEKAEALATLEEAARLDPKEPWIWGMLAIARHANGRYDEATLAFDQALRLDPTVLDGKPVAQALREAARRKEPWP